MTNYEAKTMSEKRIPKRVAWEREWNTDDRIYIDIPYCPTCWNEVVAEKRNCECGQLLDWE